MDAYVTSRGYLVPRGGFIPTEPELTTGKPIPFSKSGPIQSRSFPFQNLPAELKMKIYRLLFRSSAPLYPSVARQHNSASAVTDHRPGLPKGVFRRNFPVELRQTCMPYSLNDSYRFRRTSLPVNFLRVNRQISSEANATLWGDNEVIFQFPHKWNNNNDMYFHSFAFARSRTFVPEARALMCIRSLTIEVYLSRGVSNHRISKKPGGRYGRIQTELNELFSALGTKHQLQKCEVRFTNVAIDDNPNEIRFNWTPLKHISELDLKSSQTEICCCLEPLQSSLIYTPSECDRKEKACRASLAVDQQVLEPLSQLRGIKTVEFKGRTTPAWADYLSTCMKGAIDAKFPAFEE